MPPPDRPTRRSRGADARPGTSRRPGQGSGAIRRTSATAEQTASRRAARTPRATTTSPAKSAKTASTAAKPNQRATAHPEAQRLGVKTDTSQAALGPAGYTPRRVGLLAAVVIILLVTVSFPLRNHYQFRAEERAVEQQRIALEQEIADLTAQQEQLSDPAYVEQQARQRFGAVRPDESPYRVSPIDPEQKAAELAAAAEKEAQSWQTRLWVSVSEPPDQAAALADD